MSVETKEQDAVIQNLKDAGCSREQVEEFLEICGEGDIKRQMRFLERHRQALLDAMHLEQRRIDCLDYLVFRMRKAVERSESRA
ncbi:MAG: hypothetical protein Q4C82_02490 [Eubacteriales bacterium]|nr:hypothetical protein [Eubacteriales bacterium]